MMSRNSRKGFKKLNTHELVELNRHGRAESGSESEILDLTTVDEHEPRNGCCSSCCMWLTVLYMGILTVLLLLVAAFSGYLLATTWQISLTHNSTTIDIHADIKKLRDDFEKQSKQTYYMMNGLKETTFGFNDSYSVFKDSVNSSLVTLTGRVENSERRLSKIEENPKSVLIEQIDAIHREMAVLDVNMQVLNRSLDELDEVREQMASMGTTLSSYDAKLKALSSTIEDTVHDNTVIQDTIQGMADRVKNFGGVLNNLDSRVNESHIQMQQSLNQTKTRYSDLQSLVTAMNESLRDEMDELWTNFTTSELAVDELRSDLGSFEDILSALKNSTDSLVMTSSSQTPPKQTESSVVTATTATSSAATLPPTPSQSPPTSQAPSTATSIVADVPMEEAPPNRFSDGQFDQEDATDKSSEQTTTKPHSTEVPSVTVPESSTELESHSSSTVVPANTATTSVNDHGEVVTAGVSTSPTGGDSTEPAGDYDELETAVGSTAPTGGSTEPPGERQKPPSTKSDGYKVLKQLYDNFDSYDVSGDELLGYNEFRINHSPLSEQAFDLLDRNSDGALSREELRYSMGLFEAQEPS